MSLNNQYQCQLPPVSATFTSIATLLWVVNTVMVIGLNAVCLLVFHKTTRMEEVTKVFLMSLTSSDLMLGVCYGIPTVIISAINKWPFGTPACYMQAFLGFIVNVRT